MDNDFLIEVFKECNSHMRATERKSLIVTGSYIGLFSVLVSTMTNGQSSVPATVPWSTLLVYAFFLLVGSAVFLTQQWYRAWKEHYLDVCLAIRKKVLPTMDDPHLIPYWLRQDVPESRISVDEVLKYLTLGVNLVIVLMISYTGLPYVANEYLGIIVVVGAVATYLGFVYVVDRGVRKSNFLFA